MIYKKMINGWLGKDKIYAEWNGFKHIQLY
jgi:hypothetical protein